MIVDECLSGTDKLNCPRVELIEIVGCEVPVVPPPIEFQPSSISFHGLNVYHLVLGGIGVIESQMAGSSEFFGNSEVEADCLGVPDVLEAFGLGEKSRHHATAQFV